MVKFPEIQKQAQMELDEVVERERMPGFDDFDDLPFIRATIMEVMRWVPIVPSGLAHVTTDDDVYRGYFIPEGTLCFPLTW
jgi:cytochrome P450